MNEYRITAELFDIYNRSLRLVRPDAVDTFVCPLCLDSFKKDDVRNKILSIEHVPPKSVKAVYKTITCKQCNNNVGSQLQKSMTIDAGRKELEAGKKLKNPLRAKIHLSGVKFDTSIQSFDGKKMYATTPTKVLPPSLNSKSVAKKIVGTQGAIFLQGLGTKELLDSAYLHSSYLALFSLLGYPYIMQPFMEEIRRQISGETLSEITRVNIPEKLKPRMPFLDPRDKQVEVTLFIVDNDFEKSCFGLVIAGEMVLMPFVSDYYHVVYSEFKSVLSATASALKKKLPYRLRLIEIDQSCKLSLGYIFQTGRHVGGIPTLKLSPAESIDGQV